MRREPTQKSMGLWWMLVMWLFLTGSAQGVQAQVDEGWGSDAEVCPAVTGMYTEYNQEQFRGTGGKERETYFWARYKFTAYNQGGLGPIEMTGFFYLSKAQCYWQENKGVFAIFSPVIEYYGPRRDGFVGCTDGGGGGGGGGGGTGFQPSVNDANYDPYSSGTSSVEEDCGGGGGGDPGSGNTGIPYEPGDHTGGGTVDWGTGIGNGGTSACGATAIVEFVCIDIMTEGGWSNWSCGYVTTC